MFTNDKAQRQIYQSRLGALRSALSHEATRDGASSDYDVRIVYDPDVNDWCVEYWDDNRCLGWIAKD